MNLGSAILDDEAVTNFAPELRRSELPWLPAASWTCGAATLPPDKRARLVQDLAVATGAGFAAADHLIGAKMQGGSWDLNVRVAGASGTVPFSECAQDDFQNLLGLWNPAPSMATARAAHSATLLKSGTVLVAGGGNTSTLASAELYDPVANAWSPAASMAKSRQDHTATLLNNGMVLVAGGSDDNTMPLASAELYNPVKNTWTSAGSMVTPAGQSFSDAARRRHRPCDGRRSGRIISSPSCSHWPAWHFSFQW